MASPTTNTSTTLPRDFRFHYAGDDQDQADQITPQTPAPTSDIDARSAIDAPALSKQTFKLRRRRPDTVAMDEMPILPTVEMTEAPDAMPYVVNPETTPGYLAPRARHMRLFSPPKTPASQVMPYNMENDVGEWSMLQHIYPHDMIQRPMSAMSTFSDSSATSFGSGSSDSHPSFEAGSCTSPDSDLADPFAFHEHKASMMGTVTPSSSFPTAKRVKTTRHPKWTQDMDEHLWITYMVYCQDPRVTPFKMLPGTSPPLGVCHRVAREARSTWRGYRFAHGAAGIPRISIQRADAPDDLCLGERLDESTPTASFSRKPLSVKWPRSEGATRRRLRELCKRKPSLSAHYLRLLRTRSPSPFESSSSTTSSPAQPPPAPVRTVQPSASAFSSRSLNISLAEATAPSMQPNNPLAELARTPQPPPAPRQRRSSDWYSRIGRSGARAAHQKSQSLQLGLGLGSASGLQSNTFERGGNVLASPFDDNATAAPRQQNFLESLSSTQSLGRAFFNNRHTENRPSLNSPFQHNGPMPSVRSLKRRFGVDTASAAPPQPSLEDVFTAPSATTARNRGFSLSAMGVMSQPSASPFFSPASSNADHTMGEASDSLNAPKPAHPPRLGSPFAVAPAGPRFNTFPRRFTPRESELTEQPFEERIRQLSASSKPGF